MRSAIGRHRMVVGVAVVGAFALIGSGSTTLRAEGPSATPTPGADAILVDKSDRAMILYRDGQELRRYQVSLGRGGLAPKTREGDRLVPEGRYRIDARNPGSAFHLSLRISYPSAADTAAASARGEKPGFDIMIHGLPNGYGWIGRLHRWVDWTAGCIAVTNSEMEEIWRLVSVGTSIEIRQ